MDWFDGLKNKLFGGAAVQGGQLHHALLTRSATFEARHAKWLATGAGRELLRELQDMLEYEIRHGDSPKLHLFRDPKATGMQVKRPEHWPADSLHHTMDAFREQVLVLGYRLQMSDLRINTSGEYRERHYLKPAVSSESADGSMDQSYEIGRAHV